MNIELLSQVESIPPQLTSLGAAGLIGALWVWERRQTQKRELQLDETHARLLLDRQRIDALFELVRTNTAALSRLSGLIEHWTRDRGTQPEKHE